MKALAVLGLADLEREGDHGRGGGILTLRDEWRGALGLDLREVSERAAFVPAPTLSPTTVHKEVALLKAMLNKALTWEYLESNAIRSVRTLREPDGRLRRAAPAPPASRH